MTQALDRQFDTAESWRETGLALRAVLGRTPLVETRKWGKPCYTHAGHNIAILQRMNDFLALMFFKGALLDDPDGLLEAQGPNSRAAKRLCFTSVAQVQAREAQVQALVAQAIAVDEAGLGVPAPDTPDWAPELRDRFRDDPVFEAAFFALTPGRQRAYNLHVSGAKQSATRIARIDRHADRILAGKGLNDR